jgi:5-methylcytosine-specific restriction protein A
MPTRPAIFRSRGARSAKRDYDKHRGTRTERGYSNRWARAAKIFLKAHPLCECEECRAGKRRIRVATVVDHRIPHKGDPTLFWDQSNWQAMAKRCHDRKTARQDGGFGRIMSV